VFKLFLTLNTALYFIITIFTVVKKNVYKLIFEEQFERSGYFLYKLLVEKLKKYGSLQ